MNHHRRFFKRYALGALILIIIAFLSWLIYFRHYRYTNDAYVEGNMIALTPLKNGFVTAIHTDDTFLVEEDQLLVELDNTDATLAYEAASDHLGQVVREVCQIYHSVFASESEIQVQEAELIKAYQDWNHRIDVIDAGGVSLENLEHAEAALKARFHELQRAQSNYLKQRALIQSESIMTNPLVQEAYSQFITAWVELYRCKIYAPNRGLVAQRKAQVGMQVSKGEPIMSIIPLDQIWVNANYKETQMKKMRIGQSVKITSDLYGIGVVYHGKVVGLPGGAGNAFSLLPPQNLSGNWIKIVQRLPVRVALDPEEIKEHPLRIGLSMHARTKVKGAKGTLVPESPTKAPHYQTPIYSGEVEGSHCEAKTIIKHNLDPTLASFLEAPFETEYCPSIVQDFDSVGEWVMDKAPLDAYE